MQNFYQTAQSMYDQAMKHQAELLKSSTPTQFVQTAVNQSKASLKKTAESVFAVQQNINQDVIKTMESYKTDLTSSAVAQYKTLCSTYESIVQSAIDKLA